MSIIEQAARRLEALNRAGIAVPWDAAGTSPGTLEALQRRQARSPADPAAVPQDETGLRTVPDATPGTEPDPLRPPREPVQLDLERLARGGCLVPGQEGTALADEFRRAKRALMDPALANAANAASAALAWPEPGIASRARAGTVIVVTSAVPGEGKTACAVNLALSLAMEVENSVLLVDAQAAQPAVGPRLGVSAEAGLTELLGDNGLHAADVVLPTNLPKLSLLLAGAPDDHSHELFASPAMRRLLAQLAGPRGFRFVVVDAPAVLASTDAAALAALADRVVMVVGAARTPREQVQQAFAALQACPVVLSLLNHGPRPA